MARINGSEAEIVAQVQQIVRRSVPGANCAIRDYGHKVGCGELDSKNKLHEFRWVIRNLHSEDVEIDAKRMAQAIELSDRIVDSDC